jgi:hypothetical protein
MSRSRLVARRMTAGLVASPMVSGGVAHVVHVQARVDGFVRLGHACGISSQTLRCR